MTGMGRGENRPRSAIGGEDTRHRLETRPDHRHRPPGRVAVGAPAAARDLRNDRLRLSRGGAAKPLLPEMTSGGFLSIALKPTAG